MNIREKERQLVDKYRKYKIEDDSIKGLYDFTTAELSDALSGNNVMDYRIKPIGLNMKIIGRALTVQLPFEDSLLTHEAIEIAKPGDILVISTSNTKNKAAWGDIKTIKAMKKNIGGGELNIPITCGKVEVNPGDIVVGDDNGVVIIPSQRLEEVRKRAVQKLISDEEKIIKVLFD